MQIEKKKDIVYFAVDNLSRWDYDNVKHFLDNRIGHEITMHVGHKDGLCMCHTNHFDSKAAYFGLQIMHYPCVYVTAEVESVTDVEPVDKYEGSVDFTLGNQHRKLMNIKTIIVGVKMKSDIKKTVEHNNDKEHVPMSVRTVKSEVADMTKIFGACIPSYTSRVFWIQEYPRPENDFLTNRDISTSFREGDASARFIGDGYEGRLSDYSIDANYKYHTLLCS